MKYYHRPKIPLRRAGFAGSTATERPGQAAEAAERVRDILESDSDVACLLHEINNRIEQIVMLSEILGEDLPAPPAIRDFLNGISKAGHEAANLVKQVWDSHLSELRAAQEPVADVRPEKASYPEGPASSA